MLNDAAVSKALNGHTALRPWTSRAQSVVGLTALQESVKSLNTDLGNIKLVDITNRIIFVYYQYSKIIRKKATIDNFGRIVLTATLEITSAFDKYSLLTLFRFDDPEYKAKTQTNGTIVISNNNLTEYSNDCIVSVGEGGEIFAKLKGISSTMPYITLTVIYDTK